MSKYDPHQKSAEELLETFANQKLFDELLKDLKPVDGHLTTQHRIIRGSRGSGKTHLVTALYGKIKNDDELSKHWIPLLFPEELYNVNSLYRLLQETGNLWKEEIKDITEYRQLINRWNEILVKAKTAAITKENRKVAVDEMFEFFHLARRKTGKKILLFLENLQELFGKTLTDIESKRLRAFLNESLDTFLIVGTSLTAFSKAKDHGAPFYHFFQFREVPELGKEESFDYLIKYARFKKEYEIEKRLKNIKDKVYVYHLMTGGNPRMLQVLYDYLKEHEEFDTEELLEMLNNLTPYYKHITENLSPQKRVVLTGLLTGPPAKTPSEIAEEVEEPLKTVVSQLSRLKKENWIKVYFMKPVKGIKKSEEFFIIREYFYRIWYQIRCGGVGRKNIRWMAELTSILFSEKELKEKISNMKEDNLQVKTLYRESLSLLTETQWGTTLKIILEQFSEDDREKIIKLDKDIGKAFYKKDFKEAEQLCNELMVFPEMQSNAHYGIGLVKDFLGDIDAAIESYSQAVNIKPDYHEAWNNMGIAYNEKQEHDKAIECYQTAVNIKPDKCEAWNNMGIAHNEKQEHDKAIEYYQTAVNIKPNKYEAWYNMGIACANTKKYTKALESLNKYTEYVGEFVFLDYELFKEISDHYYQKKNAVEDIQILLTKNASIETKIDSAISLILMEKVEVMSESIDVLFEKEIPKILLKRLYFYTLFRLIDYVANDENPRRVEIMSELFYKIIMELQEDAKEKHLIQFLTFSVMNHKKKAGKMLEFVFNKWKEAGMDIPDVVFPILKAMKDPESREAQKWSSDPLFAEIVKSFKE